MKNNLKGIHFCIQFVSRHIRLSFYEEFRNFLFFYYVFFKVFMKKYDFFCRQKLGSYFSQYNLFKSPAIAGIETMLIELHFSSSFQNYPYFIPHGSATLSNLDLKMGV